MSDVCHNWKEKEVAHSTDGVAATVGEIGGVFALLKHDIPHLIKVHCIAHQLELAFADNVKAIPELEEVKSIFYYTTLLLYGNYLTIQIYNTA